MEIEKYKYGTSTYCSSLDNECLPAVDAPPSGRQIGFQSDGIEAFLFLPSDKTLPCSFDRRRAASTAAGQGSG